jgi:hypothetical protein
LVDLGVKVEKQGANLGVRKLIPHDKYLLWDKKKFNNMHKFIDLEKQEIIFFIRINLICI